MHTHMDSMSFEEKMKELDKIELSGRMSPKAPGMASVPSGFSNHALTSLLSAASSSNTHLTPAGGAKQKSFAEQLFPQASTEDLH